MYRQDEEVAVHGVSSIAGTSERVLLFQWGFESSICMHDNYQASNSSERSHRSRRKKRGYNEDTREWIKAWKEVESGKCTRKREEREQIPFITPNDIVISNISERDIANIRWVSSIFLCYLHNSYQFLFVPTFCDLKDIHICISKNYTLLHIMDTYIYIYIYVRVYVCIIYVKMFY